MSFSGQIKKEIAEQVIERPCCATAAAYGVVCFSKAFDTKVLTLHTERVFVAQWAKTVLQQAGICGKIYVRGEDHASYEFKVNDPFEIEKTLVQFGYSGDETSLRIHRDVFICERCFHHYIAAAFMVAGMAVNPKKGYCLEFLTQRYCLSQDLEALFIECGFVPGRATRKGVNVLYFKASEMVEDLLTTMGAPKSALEIMQLKVYKDVRNRVNRITNCETANIDKTVQANREILHAIACLEKSGTMQALAPPLQQAAQLRKQYPDVSLAELVGLSKEPISKSGLSHRFYKIKEKAKMEQKKSAELP